MNNRFTKCYFKLNLPMEAWIIWLLGMALPFLGLASSGEGAANNTSFLLYPEISLAYSKGESILQQVVTGKVTDDTGEPLPGVSILVKGTTTGTVTDVDGSYRLVLPDDIEDPVLVFSFVGYATKEVPVDGRSVIDVQMQTDIQALKEIVVVGYGTQRKEEITSSISRVSEEEFNKGNINNPVQLLQGKVAGLQIARPGGNPNEDFSIRLRGLSTLGANAEPLVIIDGVIGGSLNTIDPNDIESIDVLKDASAGAIYGTRASTGVIIVTTKSGRGVGAPTLTYNGYASVESISNTINVADREVFLENGGIDYGSDTDWIDEISKDAVSHVHNMAVAGSSVTGLNYRASVNYRDIQGVLDDTGFDRLNARINVNQRLLNDRLNLTGIVSVTNETANEGFAGAMEYALTFNPTAPVFEFRSAEELGRDPDLYGGFFETGAQQIFNPVAVNAQNVRTTETKNLLANFNAELEILRGWKVAANFSQQTSNDLRGTYMANNSLFGAIGIGGSATRSTNENKSTLFEVTSKYNGELEGSDLRYDLLAGYSYQQFDFAGFSAYNTDFITNNVGFDNLGLGEGINNQQASVSSFREEAKLGAYFGRVNLNYRNLAFLSSSIRREASSRFGENNRWGTFWAVSGGVDINRIFQFPEVDQLKLRAGYGVTGNEPAQRYAFLERLGRVGSGFVNGEFVPAIAPVSNPQPDLKWEEKGEFNVGLDYELFNSRLSGSFDYFIRNTVDLLNRVPVPSPPNLFGTSLINLGEMETKGFEAQITYRIFNTPDFQWDFSGNISTFETKLIKINESEEDFVQFRGNLGPPGLNNTLVVRVAEGEEVGQIRAAIFAGYNDQGKSMVFNTDGDPTTERNLARDGVIVGQGIPDFTLGFTNSLRYKNWDLNFFFRGTFGHSLVNIPRAYWEHPSLAGKQNFVVTDFFNPEDTEQDAYDSRHVEKADFLRLDNAALGYTLKVDKIDAIKDVRFYISGNNLFTITGYTGSDPEVRYNDFGDILVPGIDRRTTYFPTRTILLGVNVRL
jgi:TonB-linked SusC/RagA family outer membrane protein